MPETVGTVPGSSSGRGGLRPGVLRRIDHVAVAVSDADTAIAHYTSVLGLTLTHDERLPQIGVRLVYLTTDDTLGSSAALQLVQPIAPGPIAHHVTTHGDGLHHVCFAVDDLDQALDGLAGESRSAVFLGGRSRRCAFLAQQPNGVRIELTEERPAAAAADPDHPGARKER